MIVHPKSGGPVTVRRALAIGDSVCATVVADRLIDLGFEVHWQAHPAVIPVVKLHPRLKSIDTPWHACDIDLDGAYERDKDRRRRHFHEMFYEVANAQLALNGIDLGPPRNCKPRLVPRHNEVGATRARLSKYPRPWVMICPRSDSFATRQVPDGVWTEAAPRIKGTCFWLGRHPGPQGIIDLTCRDIMVVVRNIAAADLLATVDTGPMHIGAAMGTPIVAIHQSSSPILHLNDQNDYVTVEPNLDCLNCQENICPKNAYIPPCQKVDPVMIANAVNARLGARTGDDVSAIIPIYRPEVQTLNRCLQAVIPQVHEVIVTAEANSVIPRDALKHPKVRYVQTYQHRIGYGRNVNFGVRHSNGKYLLLLNDDVFLDPGAVDALRKEMKGGVGIVAHLLRYPTGQIYHAGKVRTPGMRGWFHIDHRKYHPTFKEPQEMENVCGASILVRREVFYQINGFDEEFFVYAEDDDFCLRTRKAGWRIRYTPYATGIHMEGQSTKLLGNGEHVHQANAIFDRKWRAYLDWNKDQIPGDFNYIKA